LQQHDPRAVAAAFVKIYRSQLPPPEELEEEIAPAERSPREHKPRAHREADPTRGERPSHKQHDGKQHSGKQHGEKRHDRPAQRSGAPSPRSMENGVWFRLNVGRERNADPKWLLPEICRQGEVT